VGALPKLTRIWPAGQPTQYLIAGTAVRVRQVAGRWELRAGPFCTHTWRWICANNLNQPQPTRTGLLRAYAAAAAVSPPPQERSRPGQPPVTLRREQAGRYRFEGVTVTRSGDRWAISWPDGHRLTARTLHDAADHIEDAIAVRRRWDLTPAPAAHKTITPAGHIR